MPEENIESECFALISIDSLILYLFMKTMIFDFICLDNCAYATVYKQMIDYLGENLFDPD